MAPRQRVDQQPGYVLHTYPYRETSLIVEAFSLDHGRVGLVARGARRPTSQLRGQLMAFRPLFLDWSGGGEMKTLIRAEWQGRLPLLGGQALLCGYYLNELLMRLLARDDPHPVLFDVYAATVRLLASGEPEALQWALRGFELLLLRELGFLPSLDVQTLSLQPLKSEDRYALVPEAGLQWVPPEERQSLTGAQWQALQQALDDPVPFAALLRDCADLLGLLQRPLRHLLNYHCGVGAFRTRQMMLDIQSL